MEVGCQLDRIQSHLGDIFLLMSMKMFSGRVEEARSTLRVGNMVYGLAIKEKGSRVPDTTLAAS